MPVRGRTIPKRPRVLVVDDEPSIRETVGEVLRDEDFEVVEATTGREAIEKAKNPRAVLSKAQILVTVWADDDDVDENIVETFVSYFRKKLDVLGPPTLHAVRNVGYSFRPVFG